MEDEELVITEDPELPDKIHEEMMLGLIWKQINMDWF